MVQALLEFSSPEQRRQLARHLEDPVTLRHLVGDKFGTFVAQACLGHMSPEPSAPRKIVKALRGRVGLLGSSQQGTFFLQRLLEVLEGLENAEMATCYLHEEVLCSIDVLAFSEVTSCNLP